MLSRAPHGRARWLRLLLLLLRAGAGILLAERLGDDDLLLDGFSISGQDALDFADLLGEMLLLVGSASG